MPSPVGHSIIGLTVFQALKPRAQRWTAAVVCLVLAASVLPDLDFLPGFVVGAPNRYHHGISHSLGFAVSLFLAGYAVERGVFRRPKAVYSLWLWLFYSVHVLADYFAYDTSLPYGEPLFWPLTGRYFISPVPIFSDIRREGSVGRFLPSLFSRHNLEAVFIELLVGAGILLLYFLARFLLHREKPSTN